MLGDGNITLVEQAVEKHQEQDFFLPVSQGIGSRGNRNTRVCDLSQ